MYYWILVYEYDHTLQHTAFWFVYEHALERTVFWYIYEHSLVHLVLAAA
jgi:hypothetical protein